MKEDVADILNKRDAVYGGFFNQACLSQLLKGIVMERMGRGSEKFSPEMREAIEMIIHKLSRIVNGNPNYADSWLDIAGYATLVYNGLVAVAEVEDK